MNNKIKMNIIIIQKSLGIIFKSSDEILIIIKLAKHNLLKIILR